MSDLKKEWLDLFSTVVANNPKMSSGFIVEYGYAVTSSELEDAENRLGFEIPSELSSLLQEFNGVQEFVMLKNEKLQVASIIWDLANIIDEYISWTVPTNRRLFCFGSSVLGNCFGYLLKDGKPDEKEIWQSDHELEPPNELIYKVASNFKDFITQELVNCRKK